MEGKADSLRRDPFRALRAIDYSSALDTKD